MAGRDGGRKGESGLVSALLARTLRVEEDYPSSVSQRRGRFFMSSRQRSGTLQPAVVIFPNCRFRL